MLQYLLILASVGGDEIFQGSVLFLSLGFGTQPGLLLLLLFWFTKPFLESRWLRILLRILSCSAVIHLFHSSTGWLWPLCIYMGFWLSNNDGCGYVL